MIVAVTGATGLVGRFAVARLLREGWTVRAWRRPGSAPKGLPGGIEWIDGALGQAGAAERLVAGADALVHAALHHAPGRFRGGEGDDLETFLSLNVGGSLDLLRAARDAGLLRAVVLSSRAVFGERARSEPLCDDDPVAPTSHYGAAKAALEAFASSFSAEGMAVASLRPTGIYGMTYPSERSKWFGLVADVLAGRPVPARAGTEVHGGDVAAAIQLLLTAPAETIAGRTFNCSDLLVQNRAVAALAQQIGGGSGPLPDHAPEPPNRMRSDGLIALGLRFGGHPLFEATIAKLVAATRAD